MYPLLHVGSHDVPAASELVQGLSESKNGSKRCKDDRVAADGSYTLVFEDGRAEDGVTSDRVKERKGTSAPAEPPQTKDDRDEFSGLKVAELRKLCDDRGLDKTVKRDRGDARKVLSERLREHDARRKAACAEIPSGSLSALEREPSASRAR